ncbi:MAG: class I SAM-dependent methyltransferase [Dehalococcoidales bacterium]
MLEELQQKYPIQSPVKYDPDSRRVRAMERANYILSLVHDKNINTYLELGCWDGMVCWALQKNGKSVVGIDNRAEGLDERAKREGVKFVQADASALGFKDGSFDFVFSYASFEHFADPEKVLKEAMRVVRPGGYIYLNFGPLYMSPWGLHAYGIIGIPYLQLLFKPEDIRKYAQVKQLGTIDFESVNGWSLEDYRNLWKKYTGRLRVMKYYEFPVISYLDLVIKYASCFKSKTDHFDDLIIQSIEVLFKKIG